MILKMCEASSAAQAIKIIICSKGSRDLKVRSLEDPYLVCRVFAHVQSLAQPHLEKSVSSGLTPACCTTKRGWLPRTPQTGLQAKKELLFSGYFCFRWIIQKGVKLIFYTSSNLKKESLEVVFLFSPQINTGWQDQDLWAYPSYPSFSNMERLQSMGGIGLHSFWHRMLSRCSKSSFHWSCFLRLQCGSHWVLLDTYNTP